MLNPLARRRRLGKALLELRTKRDLGGAELARRSGVSASVISRLENPLSDIPRKPNLLTVRRLLDALEVPRGGDEFARIEGYAEVGAGPGWWDAPAYTRMGDGQRDYAIVEHGASQILEYGALFLPGLVQTDAVVRHRARFDAVANVDAVVAGRIERQRRIADVPYRLVLEEQAVYRRHGMPPEVMREQLDHLLELAARPDVSLRVLPVRADIGDRPAPRGAYAHLTYPDPADPPIVIVDGGVKSSSLTTNADKVSGYAQLHQRLCGAAVSEEETVALIRSVANSLAAT